MIKGLDHFKEHFKDYSENFILVGGVASHLLLEEAGAPKVRPTKDLDIVLIMRPSGDFLEAIKDYVKAGGYRIEKNADGQSTFYRFQKPTEDQYPLMIELFSVAENDFELFEGQHIIPVPAPENVESLSAILLDEEYYSLIKKNGVNNDGIYILNALALIPFKAKAYLEIKERGGDSKDWKKHRSDIINLTVTFLTEESEEKLEGNVREHFVQFMEELKNELTLDLIKGACKQNIDAETVISLLKETFLENKNRNSPES